MCRKILKNVDNTQKVELKGVYYTVLPAYYSIFSFELNFLILCREKRFRCETCNKNLQHKRQMFYLKNVSIGHKGEKQFTFKCSKLFSQIC